MLELEVDLDDCRIEQPKRLLEKLLPGFISLEDDNPKGRAGWLAGVGWRITWHGWAI